MTDEQIWIERLWMELFGCPPALRGPNALLLEILIQHMPDPSPYSLKATTIAAGRRPAGPDAASRDGAPRDGPAAPSDPAG